MATKSVTIADAERAYAKIVRANCIMRVISKFSYSDDHDEWLTSEAAEGAADLLDAATEDLREYLDAQQTEAKVAGTSANTGGV
ncbi:hypothetical protein GCM10027084_02410 [Pseudoxanthomonas sangjuensis]|uniref:hypothetical protein n=1 Tax=Pseudoxanthomonas sangjuensis TaxID=1503750 RepID=UPI001390F3D2|nr:hypothetical protein [Pseudoxanthomonas sangjuensis]KAF1713875.1 hypothetical protein CSC71_05725 [Pseudoxanthomonas sangjuensis]